MSDIVSDPTTLTKDKLKKELSRLNVRLPPSDARKDVYVELYREHVHPLLDKQVSEFSSDDEILIQKTQSKSPRKKTSSPKKSPKKNISVSEKKLSDSDTEDMEVSKLTDEELSSQLRELGVDVGPILESTRRVYQKKLASLLAEGVSAEGPHRTDTAEVGADETDRQILTQTQATDDTVPVSDSDDDYREEPAPPVTSNIRQRQPIHTGPRSDRVILGNDRDQTIPKTKLQDKVTSQTVSSSAANQKKGYSIMSQIVIFVVVAVLIYLFMQNIDSKPANRIPSKS